MNYQNKCKLIRGWDDLFTKCREHMNSVAAMKLSPYYKVMPCIVWVHVCMYVCVCLSVCLSMHLSVCSVSIMYCISFHINADRETSSDYLYVPA